MLMAMARYKAQENYFLIDFQTDSLFAYFKTLFLVEKGQLGS